MAHYQQRGQNSFILVVDLGYDGRGKRIRRTRTIKIDDEALLRTKRRLDDHLKKELYKFQIEVEVGEYISTENLKFNDFVDDWIEKHAKVNLERTTLKNYLTHLDNYLIPKFGNMKLTKIKTIHIVNFLNDVSQPGGAQNGRKEPLSDSTIYEFDKTLRVIFNKAVEWKVLKESPMEKLSRPRIKKRSMNFYNENDVFLLLEALYDEHIVWRMFFITSAMSGMRRAEVIALQWNDIDMDEGYIRLTRSIPLFEDNKPYVKGTKTNEDERIIYMPRWYIDEMLHFKDYWDDEKYAVGNKWLGGDDDYVFHDGYGLPYTPNNATNTWRKIVIRHELKDIRLHDLRHTIITYLLNSGEPVFNVSKRAGHANTEITTDTYGHADDRGGKSVIKHLEKFELGDLDNKRATEPIFIDSGNN